MQRRTLILAALFGVAFFCRALLDIAEPASDGPRAAKSVARRPGVPAAGGLAASARLPDALVRPPRAPARVAALLPPRLLPPRAEPSPGTARRAALFAGAAFGASGDAGAVPPVPAPLAWAAGVGMADPAPAAWFGVAPFDSFFPAVFAVGGNEPPRASMAMRPVIPAPAIAEAAAAGVETVAAIVPAPTGATERERGAAAGEFATLPLTGPIVIPGDPEATAEIAAAWTGAPRDFDVPARTEHGVRRGRDEHGAYREEEAIVTAYCPCQRCCGPTAHGVTSTGKGAWSRGLAADPRCLPYGTRVFVPGYGLSTVDDTGGAMRRAWRRQGRLHLDLRMTYHWEARQWGRLYMTVRVYDPAASAAD